MSEYSEEFEAEYAAAVRLGWTTLGKVDSWDQWCKVMEREKRWRVGHEHMCIMPGGNISFNVTPEAARHHEMMEAAKAKLTPDERKALGLS